MAFWRICKILALWTVLRITMHVHLQVIQHHLCTSDGKGHYQEVDFFLPPYHPQTSLTHTGPRDICPQEMIQINQVFVSGTFLCFAFSFLNTSVSRDEPCCCIPCDCVLCWWNQALVCICSVWAGSSVEVTHALFFSSTFCLGCCVAHVCHKQS